MFIYLIFRSSLWFKCTFKLEERSEEPVKGCPNSQGYSMVKLGWEPHLSPGSYPQHHIASLSSRPWVTLLAEQLESERCPPSIFFITPPYLMPLFFERQCHCTFERWGKKESSRLLFLILSSEIWCSQRWRDLVNIIHSNSVKEPRPKPNHLFTFTTYHLRWQFLMTWFVNAFCL